MGIDVSDPTQKWVYYSPMSWNDDSTCAMWVEQTRDGKSVRVQIAVLTDAMPSAPVDDVATPLVGSYADTDMNITDVNGIVRGKVSGTVTIAEKTNFLGAKTIRVSYDHYSDDGKTYYDGKEYSTGSVFTQTVYTSDLKVTDENGQEIGAMDVDLHFSAAYSLRSLFGSKSPQLNLAGSHGTAVWQGRSSDISHLVQ